MDPRLNSQIGHALDSSQAIRAEEAPALLLRLRKALADLGLLRSLGNDWSSYEDGAVRFRSLDRRATDHLIRALEDLCPLPDENYSTPALKQYLDGLTAAPLPVTPRSTSGHHTSALR
jgi:hypothetical protein